MSDDRLRDEAEILYGLTPGTFTGARNDAAARLKGEGSRELADRVRSLRKPTVAAWVVNLLVRHESEEMTQVLDLGAALRQAQADLDGDALRELARQRRRLVGAVAGKGRALAAGLGQTVSESVLRQVEDTLHAAMIDTDAEAAVRSALLLDALSATGVGGVKVATAVADHTALGGRGRGADALPQPERSVAGGLAVVPTSEQDRKEQRRAERARARGEAEKAVRLAEKEQESARKALGKCERRVEELRARRLQVNGEIDELRRRVDELEDRLDRLDAKVEVATQELEAAAEQVGPAESALASARADLDRLSGD